MCVCLCFSEVHSELAVQPRQDRLQPDIPDVQGKKNNIPKPSMLNPSKKHPLNIFCEFCYLLDIVVILGSIVVPCEIEISWHRLGMGTGDRFICDTGLSIAVNQSKTGPPSTRFGFLCMHRVPGGVIKLSAPTSSLASQCLPSATIRQPFQNLSSLVPCPLSEAF